MKIVTLNIWGGRACRDLKDFFEKYKDIDIWCFQEVFKDALDVRPGCDKNLFNKLDLQLGSYQAGFCPVLKNCYGIATFINPDIRIVDQGEIFLAKGNWENESDINRDHDRKMQWFEVEIKGKKLLLMNVHLTHRPEGKLDSEKRLNQSKIICDFMKKFGCPKILVGDFNLLPDTQSITLLEEAGMKNLIKEYKITSTRTLLYEKPLQFADYIFTSEQVNVKDFKVLPEIISDHAALTLDFDL